MRGACKRTYSAIYSIPKWPIEWCRYFLSSDIKYYQNPYYYHIVHIINFILFGYLSQLIRLFIFCEFIRVFITSQNGLLSGVDIS